MRYSEVGKFGKKRLEREKAEVERLLKIKRSIKIKQFIKTCIAWIFIVILIILLFIIIMPAVVLLIDGTPVVETVETIISLISGLFNESI